MKHPAQRWARFYKGLSFDFLIQGQIKHRDLLGLRGHQYMDEVMLFQHH